MHTMCVVTLSSRFRASSVRVRIFGVVKRQSRSRVLPVLARPLVNTFHGEKMKKGFWNSIGKVPVLVLAVAVGPVAMADGPSSQGGSAAPSTQSGPIQLIAMESNSYDAAMTPPPPAPVPAAPAVPAAADACQPICQQPSFTSPSCFCGCDGGCTFQFSPNSWCNVGAGIRTSFDSQSGTGVTDRNYFAVDEARLFFTGKVTKVIGFELNTDISGAGGLGFREITNSANLEGLPATIHLLDAIVKFEFNDYANIWIGRMLPPNDRSDLSGPFFINGWDYPFVSNYPGIFEGRDDGVAYWGQWLGQNGGQLKWQFGLYNGQGRFSAGNDWPIGPANSPNTNGDPEFVMRVVLNLFDPEPGYYNASTYYGEKNIAAIGFSLTDQHDAEASAGGKVGTFFGWNLDFLLENKMTAYGSGTFEAAYYRYDVGGNVAQDVAGTAYLLFAGWLLPQQVGCEGFCGRFRPYARWQHYTRDDFAVAAANEDAKEEWDLGTQFVIKGHNARIDTFYGHQELDGGGHDNLFRTGVQLIF